MTSWYSATLSELVMGTRGVLVRGRGVALACGRLLGGFPVYSFTLVVGGCVGWRCFHWGAVWPCYVAS